MHGLADAQSPPRTVAVVDAGPDLGRLPSQSDEVACDESFAFPVFELNHSQTPTDMTVNVFERVAFFFRADPKVAHPPLQVLVQFADAPLQRLPPIPRGSLFDDSVDPTFRSSR